MEVESVQVTSRRTTDNVILCKYLDHDCAVIARISKPGHPQESLCIESPQQMQPGYTSLQV